MPVMMTARPMSSAKSRPSLTCSAQATAVVAGTGGGRAGAGGGRTHTFPLHTAKRMAPLPVRTCPLNSLITGLNSVLPFGSTSIACAPLPPLGCTTPRRALGHTTANTHATLCARMRAHTAPSASRFQCSTQLAITL